MTKPQVIFKRKYVKTKLYKKNLASAKAYNPDVIGIIKYCSLYPTSDWRVWSDLIENNLVLNNKKYKIVEEQIEKQSIFDVYYKSLPNYIYDRSKLVMIVLNETEESFVLFLGEDEKIRFSCYIDGEWDTNLAPLNAGIDALEIFIDNFDVENYVFLSEDSEKVWISKIPMSIDMISQIKNEKFGTNILTSLGAI